MINESTKSFLQTFGVAAPVVQGPMGGVSGPALVAAVANAGGLGILPIWFQPIKATTQILAETKAQTDRPFAVNIRADLHQSDHIAAALDAGIKIIHLFWGNPASQMPAIKAAGAHMIATIGDACAARVALDAGATALIAQGVEAGGHVLGETPLFELLDDVLPLSGTVPVIAAGGLATAEDVQCVLSLGAAAALMGTRFAMTEESDAHDDYKHALINASGEETVRTLCFDGMWPDAPHRILNNSTLNAWEKAGRPDEGNCPGEGDIVLRLGEVSLPRYSMVNPSQDMTGEIEAAALYAGTGVGEITALASAADVVKDMTRLVSHSPR
jgi:nitronate monooxygenase